MEQQEVITLDAIVQNIRTTVDGGWRVSFDIGQNDATAIMKLSGLREMVLALAIAPKIYGDE